MGGRYRPCSRHVLCVTCSVLHCSCTHIIRVLWRVKIDLMCLFHFFLENVHDWLDRGNNRFFFFAFAMNVLCCCLYLVVGDISCATASEERRQSGHYDDEQIFCVVSSSCYDWPGLLTDERYYCRLVLFVGVVL